MTEEKIDPEYKEGFNSGYWLAQTNDEFAEMFLKKHRANLHLKNTPKDQGMADGIREARVEIMHRDLDDILKRRDDEMKR